MRWSLHEPGYFNTEWHQAIMRGEGRDKVVQTFFTQSGAKNAQKKWALFTYSLRNFPLHPTAQVYSDLVHRTRVDWLPELNRWALFLTSRKTYIEEIKDFDNFLDELDALR
jgi:hypothetical protein